LLGYLNQPHPAQILGILRCLGVGFNPHEKVKPKNQGFWKKIFFNTQEAIRNNFVQIKTGEGKSVTLAALSIIFGLCDFDVSCACYSQYLSERDFAAFEAMFDMLGLKSQINYNTFNFLCEMEINKEGSLREMVTNFILEAPSKKF
jgi:SecA DEAD-like domain